MKHLPPLTLILIVSAIMRSPAGAMDTPNVSFDEDRPAWSANLPQPESALAADASEDLASAATRFYQQVGYRQVWTDSKGLTPLGEFLLQTITKAWMAGLDSGDYLLPELKAALIDLPYDPDDHSYHGLASSMRLDRILTVGILRYAKHLHQGRVAPEELYRPWLAQRKSISQDIPEALALSVSNDGLAAYLESLHPQSEGYQRLRDAVWRYEQIRRAGGWFPIDTGPTLRPGDHGPRVAMLKYRLKTTGDGFETMPVEDDKFDETVTAAVKHFQLRHGLEPDGVVGQETLAELNVPVEERILQLKLNMERWRWFPDTFGDRYLMVNIPAFELTIVNAGRQIDRMRVIVGRNDRQTPILSDLMRYIEFNPYWNIPQKIARKDILPKVQHDPDYLIQQGIRIFDGWDSDAQELDPTGIDWTKVSASHFPYRLRQDPSLQNALGRIKFMFPNPYSIYIHDTPGKALFNRQNRIFSSGCVRIEDPIALAGHLLSDQGWNHRRLQAAAADEAPKAVVLSNPMPVHLVYFTAWADEDRTVNFRKDVYGHDDRLLLALQHPASDPIADQTADGRTAEDRNLVAGDMSRQGIDGSPPGLYIERGAKRPAKWQATW